MYSTSEPFTRMVGEPMHLNAIASSSPRMIVSFTSTLESPASVRASWSTARDWSWWLQRSLRIIVISIVVLLPRTRVRPVVEVPDRGPGNAGVPAEGDPAAQPSAHDASAPAPREGRWPEGPYTPP